MGGGCPPDPSGVNPAEGGDGKKINELLKDIARTPYEGLGKPEPLKHALSGFWSRRINDEHRLGYQVDGQILKVAQARYRYE